ncbi:uncharacterized [Tachysurus ichikawai]
MERSRAEARPISLQTECLCALCFIHKGRPPSRKTSSMILAQEKHCDHAKKHQRRESARCRVSLSALRDLPTALIVAFCFCGKGTKEDE